MNRKNDDMLHEKNKNPLKEKETEFNKEDQVRKQAEISVCTIDTELETARNHFNQVNERSVKFQIFTVFHLNYL